MSTPQHARKLLAVADQYIAAEREKANVMEEALGEAWSLIRQLRAENSRLEEYAGDLTRAARKGERV